MEVLDDPESVADDVRAALDSCADDAALDTLADVLFPHYLDADDAFDPTDTGRCDAPKRLFELVDRALAAARRPRERATAEYLAAVLYERCAMPMVAEEHLVRAAAAQSHLGSVVERLGWYRFDRGDADGALRWWRRLSDEHSAAALIDSITSSTVHAEVGEERSVLVRFGTKVQAVPPRGVGVAGVAGSGGLVVPEGVVVVGALHRRAARDHADAWRSPGHWVTQREASSSCAPWAMRRRRAGCKRRGPTRSCSTPRCTRVGCSSCSCTNAVRCCQTMSSCWRRRG